MSDYDGPENPRDPLIAIETEAALLGAMLIDNALIGKFSDRLRAKDFAEPVHGRIWSALLRFHAKGAKATPVTMKPVFQNDPSAMGGEYLAKLADSPALTIGADDFAAQLVDYASRRKVRDAARETLRRLGEDFETSVVEIAAPVQEASLANGWQEDAPAADIGGMVAKVRERVERINSGQASTGATNLLIPELDACIGPLERGTYMVLAGRPGMGKSATAQSASIGYAANGHPGLYIQLEMSEEQQAMRVLSDASFAMGRAIPHDTIRKNLLDSGQLNFMGRVEERMASLPLRFLAPGTCSMRKLESLITREVAYRHAEGKELEFVVVDQLSFVTVTDADGREVDDDRKRMNIISRAIKTLAERLNVAIIALAQLNRGLESRTDKRPMASDLKESGRLEEDAAIILFVYREEYYLAQTKPKPGEKDIKGVRDLMEEWEAEMGAVRGKIDLICPKNRHDATRTKTAKFIGKFCAVRGGDVSEYDDVQDTPLLI